MFSRTSEHALRAVLYIARHGGGPCTAEAIAAGLGAPQNYMSKTLHELARRKILSSTRGPNGGFSLRIPATDLTIGTVIEVFDTPRPNPVCLLGGKPCDHQSPCAVHERWTAAAAAARAPLRGTTVAELLGHTGDDAVATSSGRKVLAGS